MKNALKTLATLAGMMATDAIADTRPPSGVTQENVDLAEYNNLYGPDGNAVIDQIILWNWDVSDKAYRCAGWAQVPTKEKEVVHGKSKFKDREPVGGIYGVKTEDGRYKTIINTAGKTRIIYSDLFRETWTQNDPEMDDRAFLPKEKRQAPPKANR